MNITFSLNSIEIKLKSSDSVKQFFGIFSAYDYLLDHGFLIGEFLPPFVGMKEFADLLGWSVARLSTKYQRQRKGRKVRPLLPEPVQILASTPIWTLKQAESYKETFKRNEKI